MQSGLGEGSSKFDEEEDFADGNLHRNNHDLHDPVESVKRSNPSYEQVRPDRRERPRYYVEGQWRTLRQYID